MKKLAKLLYGINGVTTIFIGALHTTAHYTDLVTGEVQRLLDHEIIVSGLESNIWKLWQGMSLMMGYFLIIIGLLHLFILSRTEKQAYPPTGASVIMMLMLIGVIYAGLNFFSAWQVFGGITGMILQGICLILSVRNQ